MKKVLLIAAVAGLAMVSCKKKYTCECTVSSKTYVNGVVTTSGPTTTSGESEDKMKKKDAKKKCEDGNATTKVGDTNFGSETTVSDCKLK